MVTIIRRTLIAASIAAAGLFAVFGAAIGLIKLIILWEPLGYILLVACLAVLFYALARIIRKM